MNSNELKHYGVLGMRWGRRKSQPHDDYTRAHSKKDISEMSDRELNDRNKRLQAERQYKDLTKKTSIGKKLLQGFIATAGTIAGVATAINTYKKYGGMALNKISDYVVKDIKLGKLTD